MVSMHIGLNNVDANHYGGWDGQLNGCEPDARDMKDLATKCGFQAKMMLSSQATRNSVISCIKDMSTQLNNGDFFFLTYSGHGGQIPDMNREEEDKMDETWVLYDGQLIDDELFSLLAGFKEGVKVFILSDSCHSGTVIKTGPPREEMMLVEPVMPKVKAMPPSVARRTYEANKQMYDNIMQSVMQFKVIKCSVILLSGCQDNQLSYDGRQNGLFTEKLLSVWNFGRFVGSYYKFHKSILSKMPPNQTPNMMLMGGNATAFARENVLEHATRGMKAPMTKK